MAFDAPLTIALSKGRIFKETLPLLAHAGIRPLEDPETSRKLILDTNQAQVKLVIIRASDVPTYVEYGAADLGVAGKDVLLEHVIADLQRHGQRVAMVGDGVNDAPALVRADVGIAMGSGTDVSIASADIVLMKAELARVLQAAALSRRTLRTIRQNIGISIVYNLIMVPMAMAALITPLMAAVSMPLSSLAVIGNSARIRTLFQKPTKV